MRSTPVVPKVRRSRGVVREMKARGGIRTMCERNVFRGFRNVPYEVRGNSLKLFGNH